jgi:hypothetical protein
MNIIEKLEALLNANRFALVNDDCTTTDIIAVSDLRAIIEEYKATEQAPLGYMHKYAADSLIKRENGYSESTIRLTFKAQPEHGFTVPVFTHPQPSDENVKDAERYRWLRSGGKDLGGEVFMYGYSPKGLDESIDEAMKAKS